MGGERRPHGRRRAPLRPGGVLYLYGPYKIDGKHTRGEQYGVDGYLRQQNPEWGIRDLGDVRELGARHR